MAYPKKLPADPTSAVTALKGRFPTGYFDKFEGKSFDEVISEMASTPEEMGLLATAILNSIKLSGDPSAFKILQASLERQGFSSEKELPITDERFREIIKVAAGRM